MDATEIRHFWTKNIHFHSFFSLHLHFFFTLYPEAFLSEQCYWETVVAEVSSNKHSKKLSFTKQTSCFCKCLTHHINGFSCFFGTDSLAPAILCFPCFSRNSQCLSTAFVLWTVARLNERLMLFQYIFQNCSPVCMSEFWLTHAHKEQSIAAWSGWCDLKEEPGWFQVSL